MQAFQAAMGKTLRLSICWLLCSVVLVSCQPNPINGQSSNSRSSNNQPSNSQSSPASTDPASTTQSPNSPIVSPEQPTPEASTSEETAPEPRPHPAFRPIFPALQYQTEVPIILPGYIPGDDSGNPLFAILESATASSYQILLAFTENCNGGNACRLGGVLGQAAVAEALPLEGRPVNLKDGITGYFVEATCGANCSDATLTWDQNGYRYTVSIKAGNEADLVKMANSAIANGIL